jgi:glycosyltransferase involved in cell wall biosynthesis
MEVTRHGIDQEVRDPIPAPSRPSESSPLRVLCLGTFVSHKGSRFLKEAAAQLTRIDDIRIEWHLLGQAEEKQEVLEYHGRYLPGNLREKIAEIAPHVVLLAPQCHETYSSTLDEAVWCGIPIICSPFGALPERVEAWGVGYVFDNTVAGIFSVFKQVVYDWNDYIRRREATHIAPIRLAMDEANELGSLYGALSADVNLQWDALVRFLQPDLVGPRQVSLYQLLAKKFQAFESALNEGLG